MKIRTKSYIEKLLPEPQPNSEPMLMGIAAAPILQNPMLPAADFHFFYSKSVTNEGNSYFPITAVSI
jgi:hypothetical protein